MRVLCIGNFKFYGIDRNFNTPHVLALVSNKGVIDAFALDSMNFKDTLIKMLDGYFDDAEILGFYTQF